MNDYFVINSHRYEFLYRVSPSLNSLVGWVLDVPGVAGYGKDLPELRDNLSKAVIKIMNESEKKVN